VDNGEDQKILHIFLEKADEFIDKGIKENYERLIEFKEPMDMTKTQLSEFIVKSVKLKPSKEMDRTP
jgi:hypothetical protein